MSDDVYGIQFATNGPSVAAQVVTSIADMKRAMNQPLSTISLGDIDMSALTRFERRLHQMRSEMARQISGLGQDATSGQVKGLFAATERQMARMWAELRPRLPLAAQLADLTPVIKEQLSQGLRAGMVGLREQGAAPRLHAGGRFATPETAAKAWAGPEPQLVAKQVRREREAHEASVMVKNEEGGRERDQALADQWWEKRMMRPLGRRPTEEILSSTIRSDPGYERVGKGAIYREAATGAFWDTTKGAAQRVEEAGGNLARAQEAYARQVGIAARKQEEWNRRGQIAAGKADRLGKSGVYQLPGGGFATASGKTPTDEQILRARDAQAKAAEQEAKAAERAAKRRTEEANRAAVAAGEADRMRGGLWQLRSNGKYVHTSGKEAGPEQVYAMQHANRVQSPLQSFLGGFTGRGFRGDGAASPAEALSNIAASAGSVAKYALLYNALMGLKVAFTDTMKEAMDFADSLRDYEINLQAGEHATQGFLNSLTQIAQFSGGNIGEALDAATRGVRAFAEENASAAEKEQVGLDTAKTASAIAFITGKTLKDSTGDVISIGNAWQVTGSRITDAISQAKNTVGGDPAQVSQGLSSIAGIAKEAGFSVEQMAHAIGLVQARTDESGQAVATRLARFISILGGTSGRGIIDQINAHASEADKVDPTAAPVEQARKIAIAYEHADTQLQGLIRNALGGSSNVKELLPLFKEVDRWYDAKPNAGAGERELQTKMGGLVGTMKDLQGAITAIQTGLVQTGIFAPVGVLITALDKAASSVARLIELFNQLKGAIPGGDVLANIGFTGLEGMLALKGLRAISPGGSVRGGLAAIGDAGRGALEKAAGMLGLQFGAAGKVAAGSVVGAGEKAAAGITAAGAEVAAAEQRTAAGVSVAGAELTAAISEAAAMSAAGGALGAEVASALPGGRINAAARGLRDWATGLSTFTKVLGLAGVALVAGVIATDSMKELAKGREMRSRQAHAFDKGESFGDAAAALRTEAATWDAEAGGISAFLTSGARREAVTSAYKTADLFNKLEVEQATEAGTRAEQGTGAFNLESATTESLADTFKSLTDAGHSAAEAFTSFAQSIDERTGGSKIDVSTHRMDITKALMEGMSGQTDALQQAMGNTFANDLGGDSPEFMQKWFHKDPTSLTKEQIDEFIGGEDAARGRTEWVNDLASRRKYIDGTPEMLRIAEQGVQNELASGKGAEMMAGIDATSVTAEVADNRKKALHDFLFEIYKSKLQPFVSGIERSMSVGESLAAEAENEALLAARMQTADSTSKPAMIQQAITNLEKIIGHTAVMEGESVAGLMEKKAALAKELADATITDVQKLMQVAAGKGDQAQAQEYLTQMMTVALDSGNVDLVAQVIAMGSKAELELAYQAAERVHAAKRAKELMDKRLELAMLQMAPVIRFGGSPNDAAKREALAADIERLSQPDTTYAEAMKRAKPGESFMKQARADALQLQQARNEARTAGGNDAMAAARTAVDNARLALVDAERNDPTKNTTAYFQALAAYRNAQRGLAQAVTGRRAAKNDLNAARRGGGLASARAALDNARDTLNQTKAGTTEYFQALSAFFNAQRTLNQAVADYRALQAQLGSDMTDPLKQAQLDVARAAAKLKADRKNKQGEDVIAQDQLDYARARNSEERTAFDQRLRDAQTAEQLGRMSHAAYIQYLRREHDRLAQVKDRTRQQQDMLDEIDQTIKAAMDQTAGQFNLADIHLPTPYEVRRMVRAQAEGTGYQPAPTINNITISGADTHEVKSVLSGLLGPLATSGTAPRKG